MRLRRSLFELSGIARVLSGLRARAVREVVGIVSSMLGEEGSPALFAFGFSFHAQHGPSSIRVAVASATFWQGVPGQERSAAHEATSQVLQALLQRLLCCLCCLRRLLFVHGPTLRNTCTHAGGGSRQIRNALRKEWEFVFPRSLLCNRASEDRAGQRGRLGRGLEPAPSASPGVRAAATRGCCTSRFAFLAMHRRPQKLALLMVSRRRAPHRHRSDS